MRGFCVSAARVKADSASHDGEYLTGKGEKGAVVLLGTVLGSHLLNTGFDYGSWAKVSIGELLLALFARARSCGTGLVPPWVLLARLDRSQKDIPHLEQIGRVAKASGRGAAF